MDYNEMAERAHDNAANHGFYEDYRRVLSKLEDAADRVFVRQIWLSHRLMLIVSELSEGLEGIRNGNFDAKPKSGGLGEELVDAQIHLAQLMLHVITSDGAAAIEEKLKYNESRPYKHGRSL